MSHVAGSSVEMGPFLRSIGVAVPGEHPSRGADDCHEWGEEETGGAFSQNHLPADVATNRGHQDMDYQS